MWRKAHFTATEGGHQRVMRLIPSAVCPQLFPLKSALCTEMFQCVTSRTWPLASAVISAQP